MGVFSIKANLINEENFYDGVEMNEDYSNGMDMALALVEARENEFAVLDAGIKQDMLAAMCEDYDERLAINEATAGGLLNKIKEIIKKLVEKLKAIFHAFVAKLSSFFMDSNKFFKKYSAEIAAKSLTDFKIKARKFDVSKFEGLLNYNKPFVFANAKTSDGKGNDVNHIDDWKAKDQNDIDKLMDSDALGELTIESVFTKAVAEKMSIENNFSNIAKEVEDYLFE